MVTVRLKQSPRAKKGDRGNWIYEAESGPDDKRVKKKRCGKCSEYSWNSFQELQKETGRIGNQRKNGDHTDHCNVLIT